MPQEQRGPLHPDLEPCPSSPVTWIIYFPQVNTDSCNSHRGLCSLNSSVVAKGGGIGKGEGKDVEPQQAKTFCKKKYAEKGALEFCEDKEKEIM